MMAMGISELLIVLLMGGTMNGSGMLGYPPGDRDAALVHAAPADSLLYAEWATRGPGEPGAEGIDGLAADPEVREFIAKIEKAILTSLERELRNEGPESQTFGKAVPPIVKLLLVQPGCVFARFDEEAAAKALTQAGELGPAAVALGIEGALVVNAGDQADELQRHIESLLNMPGAVPPAQRVRNLAHQILPLPTPAAHLELHREGEHFILAFGKGVADETVKGLGKADGGIASNERFTKAIGHAETKRVASVSWIDVKGILSVVVETLGFQGQMVQSVAESTGLDAIDSVASVAGVEEGRLSSRVFVTTGGEIDGVLALVAGRGVTPEDLEVVPGDADLVYAFSLDTKKVLAAAREVVRKSDPTGFAFKAMNDTLTKLDEELGFSIENEAFDAFGDTWILFDSPANGGVLLTGLTAGLEVRDHEKAAKIHARLMELLETTMPGVEQGEYRRTGAELAKATFMDHDIFYVNVLDDDLPFSPAFCLTKTHLLVAPHPQPLKAQLRFLAGDETSFGEQLAQRIPHPDAPAVMMSYVDPKVAVRGLYAVAPMFGSMVFGEIQQEGADIDVFSLPSARALLPYVKDSYSFVVRTDEGILVESHSGLPVPVSGAMSMQAMALPWFMIAGVEEFGAVPRPARAAVVVKGVAAEAAPEPESVLEVEEKDEKDEKDEKGEAKPRRAKEVKPAPLRRDVKPEPETRP